MQVPSEGRHGSVWGKEGGAGLKQFVGRTEAERFLHVLGEAVGRKLKLQMQKVVVRQR